MKKKLLIMLILFLPFVANAYELEIEWEKTLVANRSDKYTAAAELYNGDIIAIANTESKFEGLTDDLCHDVIIVKYDKNGNEKWKKRWGGNEIDIFTSIMATKDNGFIAIGYTDSTDILEFNENGKYDGVIVKYNESGNVEWEKNWGGNDNDKFISVDYTKEGTYNVFAITYSSNIDGIDGLGVLEIIFDKNGNISSQRVMNNNEKIERGNIILEGESYHQSTDNSFYIVGGGHRCSSALEPANSIGCIYKYNSNNEIIWQKKPNSLPSGGDETYFDEYLSYNDSYLNEDDSLVVIGARVYDSKSDINALMQKYDREGNLLWEKTDFLQNYEYKILKKISKLKNGNFLILASLKEESSSNEVILITDENGNLLFEKILPTINNKGYIYFEESKYDSSLLIGGYVNVEENNVYQEGYFSGPSYYPQSAMLMKMSFKYTLENQTVENGTSTIEQQGRYGIVKPTPNEGYEVDKVIVKDKSGNVLDVEVTKQEYGTYSFELYTDVSVEVLFKEKLVNPKTGVSSFIGVMFTLMLIGISSFFMIRNCNNSYEL